METKTRLFLLTHAASNVLLVVDVWATDSNYLIHPEDKIAKLNLRLSFRESSSMKLIVIDFDLKVRIVNEYIYYMKCLVYKTLIFILLVQHSNYI